MPPCCSGLGKPQSLTCLVAKNCINIDEVAGSGLALREDRRKYPFNKSTKKHGCCGWLDEDQQGVNDRVKPGGKNCRWDSQPWLRSLCVNTVTPVKLGPVRFILWGWRHADGPIAEAELLKGMTCDYGKTGKSPLRVIITDWQCQGVFWALTHGPFSNKCFFLCPQMVYNLWQNKLPLVPYIWAKIQASRHFLVLLDF